MPKKKYSIWHDRAVFHFLREKKDIEIYINTLVDSLSENGRLILEHLLKTAQIDVVR